MSNFERNLLPRRAGLDPIEPVYRRERAALEELAKLKTAEFDAGAPVTPFVFVIHNTCELYEQQFVVFFTVPYREGDQLKYKFIRVARLSVNEYLDWFTVAESIVDPKYVAKCT